MLEHLRTRLCEQAISHPVIKLSVELRTSFLAFSLKLKEVSILSLLWVKKVRCLPYSSDKNLENRRHIISLLSKKEEALAVAVTGLSIFLSQEKSFKIPLKTSSRLREGLTPQMS